MAPSSTSDETYLEAFIDQLSTVPAEIRRNMEWMKDLDQSCSILLQELARRQREYIFKVERKVVRNLEVADDAQGIRIVPPSDAKESKTTSSMEEGSSASIRTSKNKPTKKKLKTETASETEAAATSSTNLSSPPEPVVVIPTTEEFLRYVHDDPEELANIRSLQTDCLQRAEEKVAMSEQSYALVDNLCRRLDHDILAMEKLLSLPSSGGEIPNAQSSSSLSPPSLLLSSSTSLGKPNDLAAIQAPGSTDWILAKVLSYEPASSMYKLSDEDTESNKIFNLPESQVIILSGLRNLRTGDIVYAVYPDTTSFYKGTVSQPPRKAAAGGGSLVMITFFDDHDENGITHDKAVQLKHIMRPPSLVK